MDYAEWPAIKALCAKATLEVLGIIRDSALCRLCRARHKRHSFSTHLLESYIDVRVMTRPPAIPTSPPTCCAP
jgi:hypothetical protein